MLSEILTGFQYFIQLDVLIAISIGVLGGLFVGAIPGLTATMAVAILLPVTFGMSPIAGLGLLIGVYKGGIHAGSITAILIHTPGTPAAAATVLDGYPLAKQGKALKALDIDLYSSFTASLISSLVLITVAFPIASIALRFSAPEYFSITFFALTIIGGVSGNSLLKGLISGTIGLLLSVIGLDPMIGVPRFTFGSIALTRGISFIPLLIGMYAFSEILIQLREGRKNLATQEEGKIELKITKSERATFKDFLDVLPTIIRSAFYGVGIGSLPGIGPAIASFLAYSQARKRSKNPEKYGNGSFEGLAAAEAGNNGVTGATLIPLLTLGIPGDTVTAVILGGLLIQGLRPGARLFRDNADMVYGLFMAIILAVILMLIFGYFLIPILNKVVTMSKSILFPSILLLCMVGSYGSAQSSFELLVLFGGGILGYIMRVYEFPLAPINIAFLIGPMVEENFRRSLVFSDGSPLIFVTRPISLFFVVLTFLSIYYIIRNKGAKQEELLD